MRNDHLRTLALAVLAASILLFAPFVHSARVTAQPPTFSLRQIPLLTNDLVYHAASNTLYASVPSAAGSPRGNTVTAINPATGEILASVYVGSEPGKLALSADGQQLYVTLDGAAAVRRIELGTQTPSTQFTLGKLPQDGPLYAQSLTTVPGQPQTLLVTRQAGGNTDLAVFDQQTPRPQILRSGNGGLRVDFSAEANKLFAFEAGSFSGPALYRLTLDGSGLSVAQRATGVLLNSDDFRFMRGRLFAVSGAVINAETLATAGSLGNWGTGGLVTTDDRVGRVFLLTGGSSIRTLRAFDPASFAPLGALDVPGVNGVPSALLRWGANGLAFRTSGGQVFLLQTLLVPSNEPIPVVTPTPLPPIPTPTPAFSLRRIALPANDLAYDAARGILYASVPSAAGAYGNSLVPIEPASGAVGAPIWVGSEPGKLALSDNQQSLYVALDGARSVRRFDLATRAAGAQFPLAPTLGANNPQFLTIPTVGVNDLKVLPGKPESVAVVKYRPNSAPAFDALEIYDNGVRRAKIFTGFGGPGSIAFGATAERLYGNDLEATNGFYQLNAGADGVTGQVTSRGYAGGEIAFHEGLVYAANGQVLDPETLTLQGRFNVSGSLMLLDAANNRVYFMSGQPNNNSRLLSAFELDTLLPTGSLNLANVVAGAGSLVRWGANGLAFRADSQIYLLQTELVPGTAPVPGPQPAPTLTPLPTPAPSTTIVRSINLPANDLVYDDVGRVLYASVPASGGVRANSLTPIVPETGALLAAIALGAEPDKLALARDRSALYVALKAPNARVRKFDTVRQTLGEPFALSATSALAVQDMEVVPGNPNTLVVARSDHTAAVYDNGIARPKTAGSPGTIDLLEFGASAANLYGYNLVNGTGPFKLTLEQTGISLPPDSAIGGFCCYGQRMRFEDGLLYSSSGSVIDPEAREQRGVYLFQTLASSVPEVVIDSAARRVLFFGLAQANNEIVSVIHVFDQRTFLRLQTVVLADVPDQVTRAVRWGANGLALVANNRVYLLNTNLLDVSASSLPAAPVSVSAASYQPVVAPNSLVTAFGTQLATATQSAASLPLPTSLAGTRLSVSNAFQQEFLAQLLYVSPTQINYLIPSFIPPGATKLTVTTAAGQVFISTLQVEPVAPGLFTANASGQGLPAAVALRARADGTQSYEPVAQFDAAQNRFVAQPLDLGPATDQVFLILFGTGLSRRSALDAVTVMIGGVAAPVTFAGAQGQLAGLDQINVALPRTLAGRGDVEVALTVDGKAANPVRFTIK